MTTKIGRNDPCHCGSGKKYKHCHLRLDEQRKPATQMPPSAPSQDPVPPPTLHETLSLMREIARSDRSTAKGGSGRLLAQIEPIMAYVARREEIETASTELEKHRAEFVAFAENEDAYLERCQALFAEECFAPLWFTAAEVVRAFETVGYPPTFSADDQMAKTLRAAILHLASKERRTHLSMTMLLLLPKFVAEGRYLDGWLIQLCANLTAELSGESNPFLFQMFSHGYDAWQEQKRSADATLLREMGLDVERLPHMSLEEIDAWLENQRSDPATLARVEAVLKAHPHRRAEAIANCENMELEFARLLEGEEARPLLLLLQELTPRLPLLNRRLETAQQMHPGLFDATEDDPAGESLAEVIWPVLGELSQVIFTADRIHQLVSQLRTFRSDQFAAGNKGAAACAQAAISSLESEKNPAQNNYLILLCFASLRTLRPAVNPAGETSDPAPPADATG